MMLGSHIRGERKGLALIAVLWVVAFLSALLIVTLTMLKVDVDDNISEIQSFRAWQQAHSGLSLGLHPKIERDDPILSKTDGEFDEGYMVTIEPEAARLNINYVLGNQDKELLVSLFKNWGMEDREVDMLIDALIDWVDADEITSLNGAELEYYRDLGFVDRPYNRPFRKLDEMSLVRGFWEVEKLKPNWKEFFTVWSEGGIDIHEASAELLAAAAEVEVSIAQEYRNLVLGDDGVMGTEDDLRFSSLNEALDDMASPPERRDLIAKRFTMEGKVVRVKSVGYSGAFRYSILAISGGKSSGGTLLDYQEKQITRE